MFFSKRNNLFKSVVIFICVLVMSCSREPRGCQYVFAVYPVWLKDHTGISALPWDSFTHLAIASIYPKANGSLHTSDADAFLENAVAQAHKNHRKILISIGGVGEGSEAFVHITKNERLLTELISNIVAYVNNNELDGVDVDWEFWTRQNVLELGGNDPEESHQLVKLLRSLRKAMPDKLITVDIFAGNWIGPQYLSEIQEYADFVNLMAYDFTGAWDTSKVGHHADYRTFKKAIDYALQRGFDRKRIIVGIPAYGIEFVDGKKDSVLQHEYQLVAAKVDSKGIDINRGRIGNIFYETPKLAEKKAKYIHQQGLAGASLFSISYDIPEQESSLLYAINRGNGESLCRQ